jgi:hypothetical protein
MLANKAIHLTRHHSFTPPFYSCLAAAHSVQVMASVGFVVRRILGQLVVMSIKITRLRPCRFRC